ncbi:MAG: anti-sigma factor family protein [Gammaproteobacteria bacterium]
MDVRVVELINLELDGRLDQGGRIELDKVLANDPAARTRREQLRAVARALADAPAPTLPLDFRDRVLRLLPQRTHRARNVRRAWRGGLALAASLVVAIVVLRVVQHGPDLSPEQVGATLAPAMPTVTVTRQERFLTLDFVLPPQPSELVIELPGTGAVSASVFGAPEPAIYGRRIVVAVAGGEVTVLVIGNVNEFKANLVRGGVVTPVTVRSP